MVWELDNIARRLHITTGANWTKDDYYSSFHAKTEEKAIRVPTAVAKEMLLLYEDLETKHIGAGVHELYRAKENTGV